MTAPARFTQADIRRALKATIQAGCKKARIVIDTNGRMEIIMDDAVYIEDEEDFDL